MRPAVVFALAAPFALAAQSVPTTMNYQGRLTDNSPGQAPVSATVSMKFEIFDAASGGASLWNETPPGGVLVINGIFNIALGSTTPITAPVFSGASSARYLEITLNPGAGNEEVLAPRQLVAAGAFASRAENANLAASATDSAALGGIAAAGWQRRVASPCGGGQAVSGVNADGTVNCVAVGSGSLAGTTNTLVKFTGPTTGGNSSVTDDGTTVTAAGNIRANGIVYWGTQQSRTETLNDPGAAGSRSGIYETSAPVAASWYPNASSWQHLIQARHSNPSNNYALQIGGGFFDQDLWFRKTNNSATTGWQQVIGAGPRTCTAPFNSASATTTTSIFGVTRSNTICATTWNLPGLNFNEAQNVCFALGGHISTYNELYRLAQTYGVGSVLYNGDWIGHRAGDDQAYCVNNAGDITNFDGVCNKNDVRPFRCVNGTFAE